MGVPSDVTWFVFEHTRIQFGGWKVSMQWGVRNVIPIISYHTDNNSEQSGTALVVTSDKNSTHIDWK